MAWADEVVELNAQQLAVFGESVTYRRGIDTEYTVTAIWLETDGGAAPIRLQTSRTAFASFPQQNDRIVRNGINYSVKAPRQIDGNWIELELRQISQ